MSALGCVYVCGRSFVPAPATGIIAFITIFHLCCKKIQQGLQ
jgi:hypothetical protein